MLKTLLVMIHLWVTYGDAVGDINIDELLAFHRAHGKIGTMSMYNFGQTKGIVDVW